MLTKGRLILRDLELLLAAARRVEVSLAMSIGLVDEALWRLLEPGTPRPAARLAAVRTLTNAGLRTGVMLAPIVPGISDDDASLDAAVRGAAEAGAAWVTPLVLHLRPGAREVFLSWLDTHRPELRGRYDELYRRGAYAPKAVQQDLSARVTAMARSHGVGGRQVSWRQPPGAAERGGWTSGSAAPSSGCSGGEQLSLLAP